MTNFEQEAKAKKYWIDLFERLFKYKKMYYKMTIFTKALMFHITLALYWDIKV